MARPLRSQLNQIRAWVRQGRTDAWIAHQLEVSTNELREFRRQHELDAEDEDAGEVDLRDEIEAEIEAAAREEELAAEVAETEEAEREPKEEGYGLWLDPAVKDDPIYAEHWAGKRRVEVTIEPDRIVIKRSESESG